VFEVAPIEVHFAGYEVNTNKSEPIKKFTQKLKIINISGQVQRLTVLPPKQTKYFDVHYVKPVNKQNMFFVVELSQKVKFKFSY
jgi:hypothetical protein